MMILDSGLFFGPLCIARCKLINSTSRVSPQGNVIQTHTRSTEESDLPKLWASFI